MKVCVIGGGASGLMCAGILSKYGHDVTLFDGNEKVGKKIYITGKGRCNFTNVCDKDEFLSHVVRGSKFLFSAINMFSSYDTLDFFEELGMKAVVERGNRAFPESNKASDVTKALKKHCAKVSICLNEKVLSVKKTKDFVVETEKDSYSFDAVIVACGGKSYEATGSTGDGYSIAKSFGHNIVELKPALVPIELGDKFIKQIQGLSLKNVKLVVETEKKQYSEFGEMLFTDKGVSGPIVLTISSFINREKVKKMFIDFKPALNEAQLEKRILRDFDNSRNKNISYIIRGLLPKGLVEPFLERVGLDSDKKINSITANDRKKIINSLKCFDLSFKSLYNLNVGVITSGGVELKEINPKTMESKLVKDLYFIGEVLDIDALTGGFNLQVAFSTAYACANSFKER